MPDYSPRNTENNHIIAHTRIEEECMILREKPYPNQQQQPSHWNRTLSMNLTLLFAINSALQVGVYIAGG